MQVPGINIIDGNTLYHYLNTNDGTFGSLDDANFFYEVMVRTQSLFFIGKRMMIKKVLNQCLILSLGVSTTLKQQDNCETDLQVDIEVKSNEIQDGTIAKLFKYQKRKKMQSSRQTYTMLQLGKKWHWSDQSKGYLYSA